jgi:hypothetical protein
MKKDTILILKSELLWWVATLILLVAVLFPIYSSSDNFPFWFSNTVFILIFITFTRYIFLLKHTPLRHVQWFKVVVLLSSVPLGFYLVRELHAFQIFADEVGVQALFVHLSEKSQSNMVEYTKTEMLFFGVGSLFATVVMPFRMLISFWRTYNLGTT